MTLDSLWHKVTNKEKEEIKKEAKKILVEFASKLENIKSPEGHFKNGEGTRAEGDGWTTDQDFRNIMFENAPFKEDDSIVAEKGSWKK